MGESSTVGPYSDVVEMVFGGRPDRARLRLLDRAERGLNDPRWWIWMAAAADSPMACLNCLRNALRLDPADELAQAGQSWIEGLIRRGDSLDCSPPRVDRRPGRPADAEHPALHDPPGTDDSDSDRTGEFPGMKPLPDDLAAERAAPDDETMIAPPRTHSILVVDDDDRVPTLVEASLEPKGYRVVRARESLEVLPMARKEHPEVILVDTGMPKIDGYRICKLLKSLEETRRIPVILVSKNPLDLDQQRGRQAGCSGMLLTPLEGHSLVEEIECVLRSAG